MSKNLLCTLHSIVFYCCFVCARSCLIDLFLGVCSLCSADARAAGWAYSSSRENSSPPSPSRTYFVTINVNYHVVKFSESVRSPVRLILKFLAVYVELQRSRQEGKCCRHRAAAEWVGGRAQADSSRGAPTSSAGPPRSSSLQATRTRTSTEYVPFSRHSSHSHR